jgi:hypothetical protein
MKGSELGGCCCCCCCYHHHHSHRHHTESQLHSLQRIMEPEVHLITKLSDDEAVATYSQLRCFPVGFISVT